MAEVDSVTEVMILEFKELFARDGKISLHH